MSLRSWLITLSLLASSGSALAAPLDITSESEFCKKSRAQYPELKNWAEPAWARRPSGSALSCRATELEGMEGWQAASRKLDRLAHDLNRIYLRHMRSSMYSHLRSAKEMGIPLNTYAPALDEFERACSAPDSSGQHLLEAASPIRAIPAEIEADFRGLGLTPLGQEKYTRLLVIASLESKRLNRLINALGKSLNQKNLSAEERQRIELAIQDQEKRLIRLHFAYPGLFQLRELTNEKLAKTEMDLNLVYKKLGSSATPAAFYPDERVEELLKISPPEVQLPVSSELPNKPVFSQPNFYSDLYQGILSGSVPIPENVTRAFRASIDESVKSSIASAKLKCQNITPCLALAVEPELAARKIEEWRGTQTLGHLACACRLGELQTIVPGKLNIGLGVASASGIVLALLFPEVTALVMLAYGLTAVDMTAAGLGIWDGVENSRRTQKVAALREGGAASPREELATGREIEQANFELAYDSVTGAIGLLPPGKLTRAYSHLGLRTVLHQRKFLTSAGTELAKAATAAPPPDIAGHQYAEPWDPRRVLPSIPIELRESYPKLAQNFVLLSGKGAFVDDPWLRDEALRDLKAAAVQMAKSKDPTDSEMLQRGEIRASYCLSDACKGLEFVKSY